ncbi:Kelch repeat-containing protein [Candidatus Nitrospira bockiana]
MAALLVWAFAAGAHAEERGLPGTWKIAAPAPTKRTEVAAAAVAGRIYVVGGFEEPSMSSLRDLSITTKVEVYDPTTDRWENGVPLPVGLHHVGIGVVGSRLYVIGGFTRSLLSVWKPVSTVYAYDVEERRWSEEPSMPTARGALAVAESNGKLYAVGGFDGDGNTAAVEEYDPAARRWRPRAPLPTARDHLAAAVLDGKLYAVGGRLDRDYRRNLSVNEAYDPIADRWTARADLPTPRSGITAAVLGERIYVLGGEGPAGTFATNEAYDPVHDRWAAMAPLPTARHGLGSAVVGSRLYVISGGPRPGGSFSDANEVFEPPPVGAAAPQGRASAKQVGAVMAMLATFEDAGILPPQSSPDANRLIKALIQFQAAFLKSPEPAVRSLLAGALAEALGDRAPAVLDRFATEGWTSEVLEAVIDYAQRHDVWAHADVREAFRGYNVGQEDFALLAAVFVDARRQLAAKGPGIHARFMERRREMPGGS